jgi:hypothetical protein
MIQNLLRRFVRRTVTERLRTARFAGDKRLACVVARGSANIRVWKRAADGLRGQFSEHHD